MAKLKPETAKTLLALHGRFAVSLGLLLYVLIVTGLSSVFAREIADWSSPLATIERPRLPAGIDRGLRAAAATVEPRYLADVSAFSSSGGRIQAFFHTHELRPESGKYEEIGVEFDLDPRSFAILERRQGWSEEIERRNAANGLASFITQLHVRLHIPAPYGLLLTGILGLALMIAVISGVFMHRHLLRDLFKRRGTRGSPLAARDRHTGAASWIVPFAFVLAFTGSYFSFTDSIGLPALARVAFAGDEAHLIEAIVGVPPEVDARPAELADIDAMVANAASRSSALPNFILIERWGRMDSRVSVFLDPAEGDLTSPTYVYGGADGRLIHEKPDFGFVPSAGGKLIEMIFALHYGNFAGVWSKIVWVALGFGVAFTALSGLLLWCRRRHEAPAWRRFERIVHWVGFGLPLALVATPYGFFPARAAGLADTHGWMTIAFLFALLVAGSVAATVRDLARVRYVLLGLTGLALSALPLLRGAAGGPGWSEALAGGLDAVIALDVAFVLAGATCLLAAWRQFGRSALVAS